MQKVIVVLIIFSLICIGAGVTSRNERLRKFDAITQDMGVSDVLKLMGKPDEVRQNCRDEQRWLEQNVKDKKCTLEYQFNNFILPEFLTVGFDMKGLAITKYHYISP
jgi:hypothetical protein